MSKHKKALAPTTETKALSNNQGDYNNRSTWALPLVKARLLSGQRITQAQILQATSGRAWRLSACIHYLRRKGWGIQTRTNEQRCAEYFLSRAEISRLKQEGAK